MTDFENAAFSIFIVLISRAILSFGLNFYIPIPRTTENMETAHARNAVLDSKFWFRKDPFPRKRDRHSLLTNGESSSIPSGVSTPQQASRPPSPSELPPVEDEYTLMTVNEIINGSTDPDCGFPGLIPIVESYLNSMNIPVVTRCELARYLDLIRQRANGTLWTGAKWIRDFVRSHPEYKHDSVVSESITYDLIKAADKITEFEGKAGTLGWEMLSAKQRAKSLDER